MAFSSITEAFKTDIANSNGMARTPAGDLQNISGLANYKLAIYHRLITVPGSLVHKPGYGVGIKQYQNGVSSFSLQQQLAKKIKDQVLLDPRTASVQGVSVIPDDSNPQMTRIVLNVTPVGYTEQQMIFQPFNEGVT